MRERKITRTIKVTKVNCVIVNSDDAIDNVDFTLSGIFKTADDVLKKLKKEYPDTVFVRVADFAPSTQLYSMTEKKFMEVAEVVDKR